MQRDKERGKRIKNRGGGRERPNNETCLNEGPKNGTITQRRTSTK